MSDPILEAHNLSRNFGEIGDYDARLIWRSLGRARQTTVEVTIADPVELPIKSQALLEVS